MDNDITKNITNSINSKECENIVPTIPPENHATLIFPKISDERFSCANESFFIKSIKNHTIDIVYRL